MPDGDDWEKVLKKRQKAFLKAAEPLWRRARLICYDAEEQAMVHGDLKKTKWAFLTQIYEPNDVPTMEEDLAELGRSIPPPRGGASARSKSTADDDEEDDGDESDD